MATFTLNSRKHGPQVFTVPNSGGYVRLNDKQICEGGHMLGGTVRIKSADSLEAVARSWWKAFLRLERNL